MNLIVKFRSLIRKGYRTFVKLKVFHQEFFLFKMIMKSDRFPINSITKRALLLDKTKHTNFDAHYVYHPAWAIRTILKYHPKTHVDISSTLHFCTMLSAVLPTQFYDFRPAKLKLSNLQCSEADLTKLHFETNSLESISCMHTIEHIGLGRYGDPIDPEGDLKAMSELKRVTAIGGSILFVTPVGRPRVEFNAHRVYSYDMILSVFEGYELRNFSLITDSSDFIENADPLLVSIQHYGCGCFWFVKK